MKEGIAQGLISGAGSFASGLFNQLFARRNAGIQLQNQKELMDYQNAIQRQNSLDAALLAKRGLQKAGLSTASLSDPAQIAGVSGGSAAAPSPASGFDNFGSAGLGMYNQVRQANADISLKEQEARTAKAVADNADSYQRLLVEEKARSIGYIQAQTDLSDVQKQEAEQRLNYLADAYPKMLVGLGLQNDQLQVHIDNLAQDLDLKKQEYDFNLENMPLQLKMSLMNIDLAYKQGLVSQAQVAQLMAQCGVLSKEAEKLGIENGVSRETVQARIAIASGQALGLKLDNQGKVTENSIKEIQKDFDSWQADYKKETAFGERTQRFYNHLHSWSSAILGIGSMMVGYGSLKNAQTNAAKLQPSAPSAPPSYGSPPAQWQP